MLRRRMPWRMQPPPGTPLDWSNPIVRALSPTDFWVPGPDGGTNLCSGAHADKQMSGATIGPSPHGLAILGSGATSTNAISGYETAPGAVDYTGAAALTMFALVSVTNHIGSYEAPLLRFDRDGYSSMGQVALDLFQGTGGYVVRPLVVTDNITGWSTNNDVNIGLPGLDIPYLIVATYNPAVENGIRVYAGPAGGAIASLKNGASTATGAVWIKDGSDPASTMQMHLCGAAYVGCASLGGCLLYAGVSPFGVDATVAQQWLANPWQMFAS